MLVVLSAHGTDVSYHRRRTIKGRLYGAYLRLGSRLLNGVEVVANSHATADVAAETGWRIVKTVPLATDMRPSRSCLETNDHILFVGRLVERKGCGWFIREVLPLLPKGWCLKVAGPKWDAVESAALDHPQVDFLGSLAGETLARAYAEARCVIVPNIELLSGEYEGFGLVACEAAAAGGVVLAADCGGLTAAVVDDVTGMLVPSGDAHAWARQIIAISQWDTAQRARFVASSLLQIERNYRWRHVARNMLEIYDKQRTSF